MRRADTHVRTSVDWLGEQPGQAGWLGETAKMISIQTCFSGTILLQRCSSVTADACVIVIQSVNQGTYDALLLLSGHCLQRNKAQGWSFCFKLGSAPCRGIAELPNLPYAVEKIFVKAPHTYSVACALRLPRCSVLRSSNT